MPFKYLFRLLPTAAIPFALATAVHGSEIVISIKNQTMTLLAGKTRQAEFPISTSKFGIGDSFQSFRTPTGVFHIDRKIGDGLPIGAVFKGLRFTGEIVRPDTPGRDTIVTRVICLRGIDGSNAHAAARGIYIHGTPEERNIGKPASFGCIRMRSRDVITLFDSVPVGTTVTITDVPHPSLGVSADSRSDDWFK